MRWKRLIPFLICWLTASAIHCVSLWNVGTEDITLDFSRGDLESPFVESATGWQATASGLVPLVPRPILLIGFNKSRFENLYLDVQPTAEALGQVNVLATLPQDAPEYRGEIPEPDQEGDPWRFRFGRPFENFDASGLLIPGEPLNLAQLAPQDTTFRIEINVVNAPEMPVLRGVTIRRELWTWSLLLVPLYSAVLFSGAFYLGRCLRGRILWQRLVGIGLLVHVTVSCLLPMELLSWGSLTVAGVVGLGMAMWLGGLDRRLNFGLLVLALVFLGGDSRLSELNAARFRDLDPDAAGFVQIANDTTWFYDSDFREPLFILFVKVAHKIVSDPNIAVRLVSLICSVLLIPVAFRTGRELQGPVAGLVAAALIAASPNWISQAARGLRLEAFTLAILMLTSVVLSRRELSARRHLIEVSLSAIAICLLRVTSVWFCLVAMAWSFHRRGWKTVPFVSSVLLLLLAVTPFLVQCGRTYGDPFYAVNQHIKFYRNQEFHDQPGLPTTEELAADPYAGPSTSSWEYFFRMHSPQELGRRMGVYLPKILLGEWLFQLTCDESRFLYWWALMAWLVVAFGRQRALLVWVVLLIGPIPWLYSPAYGPEWRLVFHVSTIAYLCMGIAAEKLTRLQPGLETGPKQNDSLRAH